MWAAVPVCTTPIGKATELHLPSNKVTASPESNGIEMTTDKAKYEQSDKKIDLLIKNTGSEEITFNELYQIEMDMNGTWSRIPFQENLAIPLLAYELNPNATATSAIYFNNLNLPTASGKFRVVKQFTLETSQIRLVTEFEIE
ncbi:immunoglobulin-like domain-containing protein [Paenibacillus sp. HJGM_3]|uniref:immunoglobulin-like domain-containing protein n=1 Tax=Paenibacillus sp. HJGM_3 TaxID=3379816 RepID=UPI00386F5378